jgi:hypothetical protein
MSEPRVYQHSPFWFILILAVFSVMGIGIFATAMQGGLFLAIPFGLFFLLVLLISIVSITSKATLSETGISTRNLFGTKTLAWTEIHSVSGWGVGIKLHNLDGDITVSPHQSLPGYEEIIEEIGLKRPDLFNPQGSVEFTRNWFIRFIFPLISLATLGAGIYFLTQDLSDGIILLIFFGVISAVFFYAAFASPQSIIVQGRSLLLKYAFNERTLTADEIRSVSLQYYRTRNGKRYFVQIDQTNGKIIKLSGINPSLPIMYLTLKNWHKRSGPNTSLGRF